VPFPACGCRPGEPSHGTARMHAQKSQRTCTQHARHRQAQQRHDTARHAIGTQSA
jgi:hypothetical protein